MLIPKNILDSLNKEDYKKEDKKNDIILDIKENKEYKERLANEFINKMQIEDEIELNQYKICCGGSTDARILSFLAKFLIIFTTLIFSFVMIITVDNSAERQVFIVLVNTILAVFLPTPTIKDKSKK